PAQRGPCDHVGAQPGILCRSPRLPPIAAGIPRSDRFWPEPGRAAHSCPPNTCATGKHAGVLRQDVPPASGLRVALASLTRAGRQLADPVAPVRSEAVVLA